MTSFPDSSGIYKITCIATGKFYIGSAINLRKRCKDHRYKLNQGTHHNPKLQQAWNKYGKDLFMFEIVELVDAPSLIQHEQYWLDTLNPFDHVGYNLDRIAGSRYGSIHTPETRAKISALKKGKPDQRNYKATPETILKLRTSHTGKTLSQETRQKLSEAHKNPYFSTETREKIRLSKIGHTVSKEARARISASKTGHTYTPEIYTSRMKSLIVIAPDGTEQLVHGVKQFCKVHNLDCSSLLRVAQGRYSQHKGWKARFLEN